MTQFETSYLVQESSPAHLSLNTTLNPALSPTVPIPPPARPAPVSSQVIEIVFVTQFVYVLDRPSVEDNNGPDDLEVHCRFFQTFVTAAFPPNKRHHGCLSSFYPLETTASESSGCPRLPDTSYLTPLSCHFIQMCIRLKECSAQWFTRPNIAVSFVLLMFL